MAVMNFCGATGKFFRSLVTEQTAWEECAAPERPTMPTCFGCPLYLQAFRQHNDEPYKCGGFVVAGNPALDKARLLGNRLHCGEIARQRQSADEVYDDET